MSFHPSPSPRCDNNGDPSPPHLPCRSCGKRHARSPHDRSRGATINIPGAGVGGGASPRLVSNKTASAVAAVVLTLFSFSPSPTSATPAAVAATAASSAASSEALLGSASVARRHRGDETEDGPSKFEPFAWLRSGVGAHGKGPRIHEEERGEVIQEERLLAEGDGGADDGAHDHDQEDTHVHEEAEAEAELKVEDEGEGEGEGEGEDEDEGNHDDAHDHGALSLSSADASEAGVSGNQWGQIIGVTLLVNLASLVGVFLLAVPVMRRHFSGKKDEDSIEQRQGQCPQKKTAFERLVRICLPSFVVGALLATAAFLLFPEAVHLISGAHHDDVDDFHGAEEGGGGDDGHDEHRYRDRRFLQEEHDHEDHGGHEDHGDGESIAAAKFGVAFLGGFLLPFVFSLLFPHSHDHCHDRWHRLEHGHDKVNFSPSGKEDDDKSDFGSDEEECASCNASAPDDLRVAREALVGVSVTAIPVAAQPKGRGLDDDDDDDNCETPSSNPPDCPTHPDTTAVPTPLPPKTLLDKSLILSVITGDFLCNFADGIFVSAALLRCPGPTFLSVLLVTVLHELPQELADFFLLVEYAGLSVVQACAVNFLSGLSVTLGGIVVAAAGNPTDETVGVVVTVAGGAYVSVAACETLPRMERWVEGRMDRAVMIAAFVAGTIPFGLVLLKHEHCG